MEYVEGGDLMKHVKGLSLSEEEGKSIFVQLIQIFQILHNHSILHRDIKLDNILIDKSNVVKVCDFGVSKIVIKVGG